MMSNMDDVMDNVMDNRFRHPFHRAVIVHRFRLGRGVGATENRVPLAAIVLLGRRPRAPPRPQMLVTMVWPESIIHVRLQCLVTIGAVGAVVVRVRDMDVMHGWDGYRNFMVAVPGLVIDVAHVAYVAHVIQLPSWGHLLLDGAEVQVGGEDEATAQEPHTYSPNDLHAEARNAGLSLAGLWKQAALFRHGLLFIARCSRRLASSRRGS